MFLFLFADSSKFRPKRVLRPDQSVPGEVHLQPLRISDDPGASTTSATSTSTAAVPGIPDSPDTADPDADEDLSESRMCE